MNFRARQLKGINHHPSNLQLIAWAGSGKTEVVARRVTADRRSRPEIKLHANRLVESITPRLKRKMQPHRAPGAIEDHGWAGDKDPDEDGTVAGAKRGYGCCVPHDECQRSILQDLFTGKSMGSAISLHPVNCKVASEN
jgi:hypothetical protein